MIDCHVHLGNTSVGTFPQRPQASVHQLIDLMDRHGIEKTVLLPLESPEGCGGWYLTEEALADWRTYSERLILFVGMDPRAYNVEGRIRYYATQGAVGFGEHKHGLAFDHPLCLAIYKIVDEFNWPLMFHSDPDLNMDEVGLPRLEKCLREFPNINFIGHGPGFWAAISPDDDRNGGYPTGPIKPGGALDRLLQEYPNLYADISAGSGHNALTRDPKFTEGFIARNWRKILFGTDFMFCGQELPQPHWLKHEAPVNEEQREAIARGNFLRICKPIC